VMEVPPAASAVLHILGGSAAPRRLTGETTIGRLPECDVTLQDSSVSRRHAKITRNGHGWTITDLGSTNGVKVNGERVVTADLHDGDRIELGNARLSFSFEG
jgi:pSer/pThr/pTyr-binding forkhead associated (FHA) protein